MIEFQKELNQFEKNIIESWYNATGKIIGISIQKFDQEQTSNSPTRWHNPQNGKVEKGKTEGEKIINHYCYNVLKNSNNVKKCNELDVFLKKYLKSLNNRIAVCCKCHKGVSNILFCYQYKNFKPVFYIFIGHFLLDKPSDYFFNKFKEIENLYEFDYNGNYEEYINIIKLNAFVNEKYQMKLIKQSTLKEGNGDICLFSFQEYIAFKKYLIYEFTHFIKKYYKNNKPLEILNQFVEYTDFNTILRNLNNSLIATTPFGTTKYDYLNKIIRLCKEEKNKVEHNYKANKEIYKYSVMYRDEPELFKSREDFINISSKILNLINNLD